MACVINYKNKTYSLEEFKNVLLQEPSLVKEVANKSQERLKAIQEVFSANPELSKIGDVFSYVIYLDTIFPDSKVKDIVYHGTEDKFEKFDKLQTQKNISKKIFNEYVNGFYFSEKGEYGKEYSVLLNSKTIRNLTELFKAVNTDIDYELKKELNQIVNDIENNKFDTAIIERPLNIRLKPTGNYVINIKNGNTYSVHFTNDGIATNANEVAKNVKEEDLAFYKKLNEENKEYNNSLSKTYNWYVVFEPEQIHILGSKQDIEGFKNYIKDSNNTENLLPLQSKIDNLIEKGDIQKFCK